MTQSEAEKIVRKHYHGAHAFITDGFWSICNGTECPRGKIGIAGVGLHKTHDAAWLEAAEVVIAERVIADWS